MIIRARGLLMPKRAVSKYFCYLISESIILRGKAKSHSKALNNKCRRAVPVCINKKDSLVVVLHLSSNISSSFMVSPDPKTSFQIKARSIHPCKYHLHARYINASAINNFPDGHLYILMKTKRRQQQTIKHARLKVYIYKWRPPPASAEIQHWLLPKFGLICALFKSDEARSTFTTGATPDPHHLVNKLNLSLPFWLSSPCENRTSTTLIRLCVPCGRRPAGWLAWQFSVCVVAAPTEIFATNTRHAASESPIPCRRLPFAVFETLRCHVWQRIQVVCLHVSIVSREFLPSHLLYKSTYEREFNFWIDHNEQFHY